MVWPTGVWEAKDGSRAHLESMHYKIKHNAKKETLRNMACTGSHIYPLGILMLVKQSDSHWKNGSHNTLIRR